MRARDRDIKDIKAMLEKIEEIIDSRLIGIEEPEEDGMKKRKNLETLS
jgi:hypothetical protein